MLSRNATASAINENLSAGNFEDAAKDAEIIFKDGDQYQQAVYFIRKVCGVVVKASSLSQAQIHGIQRICCLCFHVMIRDKVGDVIELNQNLTASVFHIAKTVGKDDIEVFAEIIWASLPVLKIMSNAEDAKQHHILSNLCLLVSSYLIKLLDTLSESNGANIESQLQKYLEMVSQVFKLSNKDFSVVFSVAQKMFEFYCEKVKSAGQIKEFAVKIIFILKQTFFGFVNNDQDSDFSEFLFRSLMSALRTFNSFFKITDFEFAVKVWKEMIGVLKTVVPTSSIENIALNIIDKSLNPFLFSYQTVPSSAMPFTDLQEALLLLKKVTAESTTGLKALEHAAFATSFMLLSTMSYWTKNVPKVKSFFPVASLSVMEELFIELGKILRSGICYKCAQQCGSKGDVYYAFQLELVLLFLCAWIIDWDEASRPLMLKVCENSFGRSQQLLLEAVKKSCVESADFYSYLCDRVNAFVAHNADNPEICVKLAERGKEWCIEYIKAMGTPLPFASTAKKIMRAIALKCRELDRVNSAFEAVAVVLLIDCQLSEQKEDSSLSRTWSDLVSAFPNEYVPLLALVKTNKTVKDFFGNNNESPYDSSRLFIWESMALGSRNPQEFSVLLKHWKTREGVNLSPLQRIRSGTYFLIALGSCDDLEKVQKFVASFKMKEYHELLKIIPSVDLPVALCTLALMFYCRYFIDRRIHQASCKKRVEEAKPIKPLKKLVLSTQDVVHENDVCDLTPAYVDLTVSKEASLLSTLDTALRYWDESLKKGLEASLLSSQELRQFTECLPFSALFYRLSGHHLKENHAWEICRNFGIQVHNDHLVLRAVSGLMELGCCDAGWVQRSKTIADTLADDPTAKNVLHLYKNSYVLYCFSHDKVEEGVALLEEVLKSEDEHSLMYHRSKFILANILVETPIRLRARLFSEHYEDVVEIARDCYGAATCLIKRVEKKDGKMCWSNGSEQLYVADLLFATSLWLGYMYLKMMSPREARCFLKLHLLFVQKMGLSARTAECLSLLGQADLLVHKIEDSVVKVEGLKQILEIDSGKGEDMGDEMKLADACQKKHGKLLDKFSNRDLMLENFIRVETILRLKFADLLVVNGKDSEGTLKQALEINERLSAFLDKTQSKDVHLRSYVGEQRIMLIDIRNLRASPKVSKQLLQVGTTTAEVTPTMLKQKSFGGLKTPLPTSRHGERPRTPLEPLAAQNGIPVKPKAFIKGRGVLPLAFNFSDSDEETGGENDAKPTFYLKAKVKGNEDRIKAREKKPKPRGGSTKRKDTKTNLKPGSSTGSSAVNIKNDPDNDVIVPSTGSSAVNIKNEPDNDVIVLSDSGDDIIQPSNSEDDLPILNKLVSPCLAAKRFRTSKKVREALSKVNVMNSVDEVDVSSRKVKATRIKVETSGAEDEKAKSRRLVTASGKSNQRGQSPISVRTTRSRRLL